MSSDKLDSKLPNVKSLQPPFVNSPTFTEIAQTLDVSTDEAVRFVHAVHKIAGRGKLKDILHAIQDKNARTPQEVASLVGAPRSRPKVQVTVSRHQSRAQTRLSSLQGIAQALQCTQQEAARFVATVQLEYRNIKQRDILRHIQRFDVRTPEQLLDRLTPNAQERPRHGASVDSGATSPQQTNRKPPQVYRGRRRPRWTWNPDTGSIESPSGSDD